LALSASNVTSVANSSDTDNLVTGSITPTNGALIVVSADFRQVGGTPTSLTVTDSFTGGPLSWTNVPQATQGNQRAGIFWAVANGNSGTITVTANANCNRKCMIVDQVTGQHATTPVPENNSASGADTGATGNADVQLTSVPSGSYAVGMLGHWDTDTPSDVAIGSGETELAVIESGSTQFIVVQTEYVDGSVSLDWTGLREEHWIAVGIEVSPAATVTHEQEGYRWRNDDNDEADATWRQSQDVDDSVNKSTNIRLRVLVNTTGDAASEQYQLEYKENGDPDAEYRAVP
jgi:hypothetical protein